MTRRLRVLQIANQPGPLRLFMLPVCRAMHEAGARVELACMKVGANYQPLAEAGFPIHALTPGRWSNLLTWDRTYRQVRSLLRRRRYDLMVAHTPAMSWIARLAAKELVAASVYLAHGLAFAPHESQPKYWLMRRAEEIIGQYTDAVMVMNEADAEACRKFQLTRRGGQWFKIPGVGIDVGAFSAGLGEDAQEQLDAEMGLSPDRPVVLYLGRFIATKRPGDILELARRTGGEVDFILAGEGPLWRRIKRRAASVGAHVRVLGWTEQAVQLVQRCTLVAFPSVFHEGLPRLLLEAQAAGKPVVAYDVRGSCDAIDDQRTGLLVRAGDVRGFCDAALRLLGDQDMRRRMGAAGRQRTREEFSLEASIAAQLRALAEVLKSKGIACPWD